MELKLLMLDIPTLSDETIVEFHAFLAVLLNTFDAQYYDKIQYQKESRLNDFLKNLPKGQDPF